MSDDDQKIGQEDKVSSNSVAPTADDASAETAAESKERRESALENNISTKGKNAYYYAHGHKVKGPKWDGKAEPKPLSRDDLLALSMDPASNQSSNKIASFDFHKSNITSYAFLNEEKVVKLYITLEGVGDQCTDDDITLEYTESSLSLVIKNYKNVSDPADENEEDKSLSFGRLTGKITHAKYKLKTDKIILILEKEDEGVEWHTINDKGEPDHFVV